MMRWACAAVITWLMVCGGRGGCEAGQAGQAGGPPGERDMIVFIAHWKPTLYQMLGNAPQPLGEARFQNAQSLAVDPATKRIYVLDARTYLKDGFYVWRINPDGTGQVLFKGMYTTNGGPFGHPASIHCDGAGGVLLADPLTGLWRIGPDGRANQLLGKEKPFKQLNAAVPAPGGGYLLACGHQSEITGQLLIFRWSVQGGLFWIDGTFAPASARMVLENRHPGQPEEQTLWRKVAQIFPDAAGRLWLVDAGQQEDKKRVKREINGGVFMATPDGRFEDLTYKTPDGLPGPMRFPTGIAQWDGDTCLIADWGLYLPNTNRGAGGLMLLKPDGRREAKWHFGWQLKPMGVGILRNVK
jgi:hypothetical protein